jgi:hypothetical protein
MRRDAWHCKACGKNSYPSQRRAEGVIEWVTKATDRKHLPKRAYECPYGNGWHLTSQKERSA